MSTKKQNSTRKAQKKPNVTRNVEANELALPRFAEMQGESRREIAAPAVLESEAVGETGCDRIVRQQARRIG